MIKKKLILGIFFIIFLNGCVQSTSFLGPAYTLGTTGNALQAGLSFGTNKTFLEIKKINKSKDLEQKKNYELRELLEARIKETRKKIKIIK
tara:strand:- start:242 stop:514 length:273 start_codon:yes stop_codon:yes gene_type:complete